jgi:hypothetical protein
LLKIRHAREVFLRENFRQAKNPQRQTRCGIVAYAFLLFHSERQKRDVPRPLYRRGKLPLVLGAATRNAARQYLATFGNITAQANQILVVDMLYLVCAKVADFSSDPSIFIFIANQFVCLPFQNGTSSSG